MLSFASVSQSGRNVADHVRIVEFATHSNPNRR